MQVTLDEFLAGHMQLKLEAMFQQAYEQGVQDARTQYELPQLMTRKQFMEFANISEPKCAELFRRADFPLTREFGHPRVPTRLLFEWIAENTEWVRFNAPAMRQRQKKISG
ncbi:hypothetical protein NCCP2716_27310 [Sporosarcina sp. NCCP-2716]|uniref:DNA-binding protein n=1 Tax=Sporosarcina sp. NCCP-2716 TaxID=2943679 RepID=UPI00203F5174|nr:DNA-binding protein [Sporosarcina sp. NCCP-2716]GKV70233.1 hypothetical protein NCCP2716_27310 [Sporosarcina sp. NCCP-2716]